MWPFKSKSEPVNVPEPARQLTDYQSGVLDDLVTRLNSFEGELKSGLLTIANTHEKIESLFRRTVKRQSDMERAGGQLELEESDSGGGDVPSIADRVTEHRRRFR